MWATYRSPCCAVNLGKPLSTAWLTDQGHLSIFSCLKCLVPVKWSLLSLSFSWFTWCLMLHDCKSKLLSAATNLVCLCAKCAAPVWWPQPPIAHLTVASTLGGNHSRVFVCSEFPYIPWCLPSRPIELYRNRALGTSRRRQWTPVRTHLLVDRPIRVFSDRVHARTIGLWDHWSSLVKVFLGSLVQFTNFK
jgi:hypothetical protein